MVSKSDICSILESSFVDEGFDSFVFREKDKGLHGLKEVRFDNSVSYLVFSSEIFKKSRDIYKKRFSAIHLKKDCDQVVLFEKNNKTYICWIEVKTSLHEIYKKGIFQIPGCYYKIKLILNQFNFYSNDNVIEYALAIYADDAPVFAATDAIQRNDNYMRLKTSKISAPPMTLEQKIERKYSRMLCSCSKGMLDGKDFDMHKMPIRSEYIMDKLPFIIWPVSYRGAVVDMDKILALL